MTIIGTTGAPWRARVSAWGSVDPLDAGSALDWLIGADDRWHVPRDEPSVRQTRLEGTPVVETRVRVPSGDVIHRAYAAAAVGVVVQITNDSPLPVAVALTRPDVVTSRPPSSVPVTGISLPAGSVVVPVAHRTSVTVVLPVATGAVEPAAVPDADAVVRGWRVAADVAGRLELPDASLVERIRAARCDLLLADPAPGDRVAWLLGAGHRVRLGEPPEPLVVTVADAAVRLARDLRRASSTPWRAARAITMAADVLRAAGEATGADDLDRIASRLPTVAAVGADDVADLVGWLTFTEDGIVGVHGLGVDLFTSWPSAWDGQAVEVHRVPTRHGAVSAAVRWHGPRPAVLWEVAGEGSEVLVRAPGLDRSWSSTTPRGEALLATT